MMISIAWKGQTNRWMWASLFSAMTILLPVMSARGEIQNDAVGFSTNHVLESAQAGENVDVMTGNLTLTIPLGPRYKLTDRFSYGVTLTYNSKVWEHDCRDVPATGTPEQTKCHGEIVAQDEYGLGFTIWPARIYHKSTDKLGVDRLVMEDGSEHFVCNGTVLLSNCTYESTIDSSAIVANVIGHSNPVNGWEVFPGDGRRIVLARVLNSTAEDYLALVSSIESVERVPGGTSPAYHVDYAYSSGDTVSGITDSQGRQITFTYGYPQTLTIGFPSIASAGQGTYNQSAKANYVLHFANHYVLDPSDGPEARTSHKFLEQIDLPNRMLKKSPLAGSD